MSISDKVRKNMAAGSWIRRMFEEGAVLKQRYGADNVFDLSLGNPITEPPHEFQEELRRLVGEPVAGMHRYMENAGYADTRTAVAEQLSRETGLGFTGADVVMTCGAAGALNVALKTILNPGDEVIVFSPYFVEYLGYVDNHGGVSKCLPTDEHFLPRLDALEGAIGPKTRAVIINSPNNPTGVVYDDRLLGRLAGVLEKKENQFGLPIFLLSDEPYRKIIYDGLKYPAPLVHHKNTIVCTSHSKDLALPGERIGYAAVHPDCRDKADVVSGIVFCNRILGYVNAPALMQRVVGRMQNVTVSIADYQEKRDFLYDRLTGMGYAVTKPQGAFYMFPKTPTADDVAFVRKLAQFRVLTVPGSGFGTPGYFRIAYCVTNRTLEGSLDGLRQAIG